MTLLLVNTDKPKIEELQVELAFWNKLREVYRNRNLNLDELLARLVVDQRESLTSPGGREQFAELCGAGCLPQGLALLVALLRHSQFLETFWAEMVGRSEGREQASRTLENAAQTLEHLFADLMISENKGDTDLSKIGRLPVSQVIDELRFYVRLINFAKTLKVDTQTHSVEELSKYLLASHVKGMTGRFRDRSVSVLIEELVGSTNYGEVAHRMWRRRNYSRLGKHYSWMTRMLVAMSVVVAHTA